MGLFCKRMKVGGRTRPRRRKAADAQSGKRLMIVCKGSTG